MKAKSNRTKVLYRRVSDCPELVDMIDRAILAAARDSFKVEEGFKREYGLSAVVNPAWVEAERVPHQDIPSPGSFEVERLKKRIAELEKKVADYEQTYG